MLQIIVKRGSICTARVDAIVNPANCYGSMGGGVARAIRDVGGRVIEDEAIHKGPVNLGDLIVTRAGSLICGRIIHAPTMENPADRADPDVVREAMESVLDYAARERLDSLAFPGMGTGVGGLDKREAAKIMITAFRAHTSPFPRLIELYALDEEMVGAWRAELGAPPPGAAPRGGGGVRE